MDIKDIYYGNITPADMHFESGSVYIRLNNKWLELEKEFTEGLSEKQKEQFCRLCEIQSEQTTISNERCYTDGFRDGTEVMLDILNGGDDE